MALISAYVHRDSVSTSFIIMQAELMVHGEPGLMDMDVWDTPSQGALLEWE